MPRLVPLYKEVPLLVSLTHQAEGLYIMLDLVVGVVLGMMGVQAFMVAAGAASASQGPLFGVGAVASERVELPARQCMGVLVVMVYREDQEMLLPQPLPAEAAGLSAQQVQDYLLRAPVAN